MLPGSLVSHVNVMLDTAARQRFLLADPSRRRVFYAILERNGHLRAPVDLSFRLFCCAVAPRTSPPLLQRKAHTEKRGSFFPRPKSALQHYAYSTRPYFCFLYTTQQYSSITFFGFPRFVWVLYRK